MVTAIIFISIWLVLDIALAVTCLILEVLWGRPEKPMRKEKRNDKIQ